MAKTMSSREANQSFGKAQRAADEGPLTITNRGRKAYVLLRYEQYEKLVGPRKSLVDMLHHEESKDIEFEPARMRDGWLQFEFD